MPREKESRKRYTVTRGNLARPFPSMGLAVAFSRRLLRLNPNLPDDLTIDVEHLAGTGPDYGWYPWASYQVMSDGSYERIG